MVESIGEIEYDARLIKPFALDLTPCTLYSVKNLLRPLRLSSKALSLQVPVNVRDREKCNDMEFCDPAELGWESSVP
ncbi:hypothetical protein RRG08_021271 [Elysia crispata]|uniref:Uncharacterized protein n=1 Tax=Elysia crispata TaxID=231223 RepID=A0AAE0YTN4_9GAST|nr:hypothetical protein RRG08_021271 [Elysia crispata]